MSDHPGGPQEGHVVGPASGSELPEHTTVACFSNMYIYIYIYIYIDTLIYIYIYTIAIISDKGTAACMTY